MSNLMKPWQADQPEEKRFRWNRIGIVGFLILFACSLVYFLMPSARQVRVKKQEVSLSKFLNDKKGRVATPAEISEITLTNNFLVRKVADAPKLYLFIPSLNNNIAVLGRLDARVRPSIGGYSIYIIPRPNRESPTSEKSVGMCLLTDGKWNVSDLIKSAPNIGSSIRIIDEMWLQVPKSDKAKISLMLSENERIQHKYGDFCTLVLDGKKGYLFENWFDVSELLGNLQELHRSGG
ncbi:MAG: hypothetical protein WCG75_04940 [Armatimonadota bacterium]